MRFRLPRGRRWLAAPALAVVACATIAATVPAGDKMRPAEVRLRADVGYLAHDLREGRGPGTRGLDDAADHIAAIFREVGLTTAPGAEGYFQPFTIRGEPRLGSKNTLALKAGGKTIEGQVGESFEPLNVGGAGQVADIPVVFAGYGITADDDNAKIHYDDYDGIDVKDRAVLILRREPSPKDESSGFAGPETTTYSTFTFKAVNAEQHGAKAVLLVNDAESAENGDALIDFAATPRGSSIPVVMITRETADRILKASGAPSLDKLEARIDETGKPASAALEGATLTAEVEIDRGEIPVKNVVGVLEGKGPHADETIIVGAHYDHLGHGGFGSLAFGSREIHNGADDNASGTATVLELARRLAARRDPLPRRVVFMLFSAEERGLLGSQHYVDHPLYPLDKTVFMVNYDMVGRLNTDNELIVYGTGSSGGLRELVEGLSASQNLKVNAYQGTRGEFNQSDHASFYRKNIPVLFFFTGTHPDYHRPADDADRINYDGMVRIADLGELILLDLARRPEAPKFLDADTPTAAPTETVGAVQGGHGVYFGSRPNYAFEGVGVKLDGVTEGSPAEKAGLQGGDVILRFANVTVTDVESYMAAMNTTKPGDEVEVVVLRDGERTTLKATLGKRPSTSENE